jgi:heavy metal sensor kinase
MRSIRVSLLTYFLLFLAIVLGVVSWYAYAVAEDTMLAKEASERNRIDAEYARSAQETEENFDQELLRSAHRFAGLAASQWPARTNHFAELAPLSLTLSPFGVPGVPCWNGGEAIDNVVFQMQFRPGHQTIKFMEDILRGGRRPPDRETEYFQLYNLSGAMTQRSRSLGDSELTLEPRLQRRLRFYDQSFDELDIKAVHVRRVTIKLPVTKTVINPFAPPRPRDDRQERGPVGRPAEFSTPGFFIQFARITSERDLRLNALKNKRDRDRDSRFQETQASLATLRTRLLTIALATFGFTLLGGMWLIHRVLRPVGRITAAVSQVSELDFQLRLKRRDVPEELLPIVDKLQGLLQSLEKAFAREKQAAADISHELRTPIASLLATVQVCLRKERGTEEYRTALKTCNDIGMQLSGLVERLLTLARIDAGVDKLYPEVVDVPELAEECVSMIRPLAESRDVSLRLERNGPIVIETDPDKLREIVNNLLHNAIQYNRPHGRIDLSVARENGHVQLEVRDTGIGIPEKARAHLFERFYRADPSRQSDTVHAGLGLAIIKGYLDLMGGKIEVESEEGRGSTFRVLLPAKELVTEEALGS